MKNKSEFIWIMLVFAIASLAAVVRTAHRTPGSDASPAETLTSRAPQASRSADSVASPASPSAGTARASFFVEQTHYGYDGSRTFYRFELVREKAGSGARYEAGFSADGQTRATSGRLDEKACNDFFEELGAHGAWRLVDAPVKVLGRDTTRLYIQEGSRSHLVTYAVDSDQVSRSVDRFLSESVVGTVQYELAKAGSAATASPSPAR